MLGLMCIVRNASLSCLAALTGCLAIADAPADDDAAPGAALVGPIRVVAADRRTRGEASLSDAKGGLADVDEQVAPDLGPFAAAASAGVTRGDASSAGVTTYESSLGGRELAVSSHCDANGSVSDPELAAARGACANRFEVDFEVVRPAKVYLAGAIDSAHTGLGGGWGEIALRDGTGATIEGVVGDHDELGVALVLAPGPYHFTASGQGGASTIDIHPFSAATFDLWASLVVRTY